MDIAAFINWFINPSRMEDEGEYRRTRLFVRASLLTSLFSNSYIWLSWYFEYDLGVYLMIFNVVGFLILALLVRTKMPLVLLGNLYILVGAIAVIVLAYYSGGIWSAVYPWIISIPVLALLVVNRKYGIIWAVISYLVMNWYGILELNGHEFPIGYNPTMKAAWFVSVLPGLLLIIVIISLVFESTQTKALKDLEEKNEVLLSQKETIADQAEELEKLIDEKDHIIRILAHDLKNPLANITTISNILKEEQEVDQQKKFIAMIEQVSAKAQGLVNSVLDMAILEQGGIKLNLEEVDLQEAITEAISEMEEQSRQKSIGVKLNAQSSALVEADRMYLLLIFENLISNAIKFSEKGSNVEVEIKDFSDKVQVYIKDEGPGIKPEEESQLFGKFTKLSARPTGEESSTGLGLSLVKRYVEQINGKVWYDREASKGATFVVELPVIGH